MRLNPLLNANASVITVTGTATALKTLLDTASGSANVFRDQLDAADIVVEDGDVRILYDNNTPTSTKGILLKQGTMLFLRHVRLDQVKLIRVSGNVSCSVQVGHSDPEETTQAFLNGVAVTLTAGDIEIGAVEIKNGTDDTRAVVSTAGADAVSNTQNGLEVYARLSAFNGTTWERLRTAVVAATSTLTGILNTLPLGRYNSTAPTLTDGQVVANQMDANGNIKTTLATTLAGEDTVNDVMKVEQRFSYIQITADQLVKTGAGVLHTLTFSQTDATPTAGTLDIYDNTAGSGTKIYTMDIPATAFAPYTLIFDASFSNGLYIDFTTTADVSVTATYR